MTPSPFRPLAHLPPILGNFIFFYTWLVDFFGTNEQFTWDPCLLANILLRCRNADAKYDCNFGFGYAKICVYELKV